LFLISFLMAASLFYWRGCGLSKNPAFICAASIQQKRAAGKYDLNHP